MATRALKRTTSKPSVNETPDVEITESAEEVVVEEKKPRKYKDSDGIPCESITNGELGMIGLKSNINYRWVDYGDVVEIEYADLVAAVRSSTENVTFPRFIVKDEDFIDQYPQLNKIYEALYEIGDLKDILRMPPSQMERAINTLPKGAKESIKGIAATMIESGQLDSVKTIKKLDEIFGVQFSLIINS